MTTDTEGTVTEIITETKHNKEGDESQCDCEMIYTINDDGTVTTE